MICMPGQLTVGIEDRMPYLARDILFQCSELLLTKFTFGLELLHFLL